VGRTPVRIHRNDELTELDGPTQVWPGTYGGVLTPPSTAGGVVYVATLNAPTEMHPDKTSSIGSELGTAPGEAVAVDASDGMVLWATEVDGDPLGGATVVGDLVLTATYQGEIYALARDDGRIVRVIEAPAGINGWPAIADDRILWPVGMASPPSLVAYGLPEG
jgi:outer membrane protein assembly factor BamB